jgi:hypothetical protein
MFRNALGGLKPELFTTKEHEGYHKGHKGLAIKTSVQSI